MARLGALLKNSGRNILSQAGTNVSAFIQSKDTSRVIEKITFQRQWDLDRQRSANSEGSASSSDSFGKIELYRNPIRLNYTRSKINTSQLTTEINRHVTQVWGDNLYDITMDGKTGYMNVHQASVATKLARAGLQEIGDFTQAVTDKIGQANRGLGAVSSFVNRGVRQSISSVSDSLFNITVYDTPAYKALKNLEEMFVGADTDDPLEFTAKSLINMVYRGAHYTVLFSDFGFTEVEESPWQFDYTLTLTVLGEQIRGDGIHGSAYKLFKKVFPDGTIGGKPTDEVLAGLKSSGVAQVAEAVGII